MIYLVSLIWTGKRVKFDPMKFLVAIIRYIHYTMGITTPRPEQERMAVAIWIVSLLVIAVLVVGVFLLLASQLQSTR